MKPIALGLLALGQLALAGTAIVLGIMLLSLAGSVVKHFLSKSGRV